MQNVMDHKGKMVRLFLCSGREVQGQLEKHVKPDTRGSWHITEEEYILQDHGQEVHIRADRIEGYVVL